MSAKPSKRKVFQKLSKMGFSENSIRSAINVCGYNVEQCSEWIINKKANAKPKLFVGMEVWIFSKEDREWRPGNIVSITKQLVSIIFNGWDFRWLEKESDQWRIQDEPPEPPLSLSNKSSSQKDSFDYRKPDQHPGHQHTHSNSNSNNSKGKRHSYQQPQTYYDNSQYPRTQQPNRKRNNNYSFTAANSDEIDYFVTFTESVLGLELFSDEDGFNCIVGRCVSTVARQKVTPSSLIVQVNDRWLAGFRFEEIRDAVKQAARNPPLHVTFRIKKEDLKRKSDNYEQSQNPMRTGALFNTPSPYSGTSPEEVARQQYNNSYLQEPQTQPMIVSDEEKHSQPPINDKKKEKIKKKKSNVEFGGYMNFMECDQIKIGDHIDHRDDVGRFLLATIVDKQMKRVKIHYEGWNSKWDTWCNYQKEPHRFAKPRSISRKPNTRFRDLKIRDYVDINPIQRHKGWRVGQIRRMDKYSGQAQIVYKEDGQEFLYWAHLNNPLEISPFMTKAAETIALTRHLQDFKQEGDRKKREKERGKRGSIKDNVRHGPSNTMANVSNIHPIHKLIKKGASTAYTDQATYSFSGYKQIPTDPLAPASSAPTIQTQKMLFGIPLEQQMSASGGNYMNNISRMKRNSQQYGNGMVRIGNNDNGGSGYRNANASKLNRHSPSKALPPLPPKQSQKKRFSRSRTQPLPKNEEDVVANDNYVKRERERNYSLAQQGQQGYIQPINEMYVYDDEQNERKQSNANKNIPKKKMPARPPPNSGGGMV